MKTRQTVSIALLILLLFTTEKLSAQFWGQQLGGNEVDEVMDIARDAQGNIYSAGYFTNQVTFGTSINYSSYSFGIPDIFIQKSGPSGNVLWATQAGGIGSDRTLSIAIDGAGNSYITGFYFGTATFGSITLTSANGSKDCFIAKINSTGNFVWAVSAGGSMADIGNSVALDPSGNLFIAGQFEGTAGFGSSTYTSMTNPNTGFPSIDVFISKLDNNGNFLWTKHGAAEFTDRALDVICNSTGDAYVCGQFSDTIQFANTYNNQVMNSIFLMKISPSGNETWFRRASGTYSIAYSLALDNNQDVYMTGDYQGQLAFFGTPTNFLSDNYSDRVFLVKYSPSGSFIWASSASSNSQLSSRVVAVDPNNDPYILGEYRCTFNDYADLYGQGTFNSIGYKDLFVTKFNSSGSYQWARNFGGPGMDQAHGFTVKTVDRPIVAGSYEKHVTWPVSPVGFNVTSQPGTQYFSSSSTNASGYCNDSYYGNYDGLNCLGFSDGFISDAIDITREPYDYYERLGAPGCSRPFVSGCIDSAFTCPDTLVFCGQGNLNANTWTSVGTYGGYGPMYHYQWTPAPNDTMSYKMINTTGTYSVSMTTYDGCYSSTDVVYAVVHPLPAGPTISDDEPVNTNSPPFAMPITLCAPDSVWLWGGNYGPTDTIGWYDGTGPGGNLISTNDSINVWTTDWYTFTVTNVFGCVSYNHIYVQFDNPQSPWVIKSLIPDTFERCFGQPVYLLLYDSVSNPSGNPNYILTGHVQHWTAQPNLNIGAYSQQIAGAFLAQTSGTYIVTDTIYQTNTCGTTIYIVKDTFYLLVHPNPTASIAVTSPQYLCPGDTALITAVVTPSTTTNTTWTINPNDTIWAFNPGNYQFVVNIVDTITGCSGNAFANRNLPLKPSPVLTTVPLSGIICPNDSAMIHCSNGTAINYQWIGPNGVLPQNTQDIWDSVPGFYHCIITDVDGCVLTSNTVELNQYNTPYLVANPGNVVCLNQAITLQVITGDSTLIVWNAPLSGGGTQQVVTQTGTYSCSVTMCGITTICSIQVVISQAVAVVTGDSLVCPGDSVWLHANSGMAGYTWSPVNSFIDSVYVTAGSYTMTTTDMNGCTSTASFTVAIDSSVTPPMVSGDTVCVGSNATVTANAQGAIDWYDLPAGGNLLGSGSTLQLNNVQSDTTVYVWTQDTSGCHSVMQPVYVFVDPVSVAPLITSNDTICAGDTIWLTTPTVASAAYNWSGPNGFTSSQQNNFITPADTTDSGTYSLYLTGLNCTSASSNISIVVLEPIVPMVSWSDTVCEGASVSPFIINADSNLTYIWNGPQGFNATGSQVTIGPATPNMSGNYSVVVGNMCASGSSIFSLVVLPAPGAFAASVNSPLCPHDTIYLQATSAAGIISYEWFGPNGFYSSQQNTTAIADPTTAGTYSVLGHDAFGCASLQPQTVTVVVHPSPIVSIGPDTLVCAVPQYIITASGNYPSYTWHDNSTGPQIAATQTGLYWVMVVDSQGCRGYDSAYVEVIRCDPERQNIFTPNNDGVNDLFNLGGQNYRSINCQIFDRWGALVYEWTDPQGGWNGTYKKTNEPVEEGVYYYIAQIESYDNEISEVKGFIQLMR
jgi:gliding motility-associated-like protein